MAQLFDYSNTHTARALFAWTHSLKMEGDTVAGPASPPTSHTQWDCFPLVLEAACVRVSLACFW